MVNYTRKKGGKFIAQGSYGCVFGPPLKCKENSERMNNSHISKLMRKNNAENEFKESQDIWHKFDPTNKFSLSAVKLCNFDNLNVKATNEFEKCEDTNVKNSLLIYKNGGLDLSKLKPHPKNYKALFKELLNLMKGLQVAHNNNVVHGDIKTPNIVAAIEGDNIHLRFIDYGLSKDLTNDTKYDATFLNDNIFYPYWPFEFGCFDEDGDVISKRHTIERLDAFNNGRSNYSTSYRLGTIEMDPDDVHKAIESTNFHGNENIKLAYKRLDVYSMGVLLANLLYEYFSVSLVSRPGGKFSYPFYYDIKTENFQYYHKLEGSSLTEKQIQFHRTVLEHIINPMITLIDNMTHVNPNKRYTISQAIEEYSKLISAFDKYLDSKDVSEGLEGQFILNKKPDIPHIKTPSSPKKNSSPKNSSSTKKNSSPKKNNSSPKKVFKPLRMYELRKNPKKKEIFSQT